MRSPLVSSDLDSEGFDGSGVGVGAEGCGDLASSTGCEASVIAFEAMSAAPEMSSPCSPMMAIGLPTAMFFVPSGAWAEEFVPDLSWVGFDPANGICTTDAHARVAIGLDYLGAAPVRGTRYGGGTETLSVTIKVDQVGRQSQWQSQS